MSDAWNGSWGTSWLDHWKAGGITPPHAANQNSVSLRQGVTQTEGVTFDPIVNGVGVGGVGLT